MQTRHLSPNQIWIETPLSAQTCLLVWRAMAACGLREGKTNSFEEEHFGPNYSWQPHLVEGRTSQGLFAPNVKLQAKLTAQEEGTLLEFAAANIRGLSDFGASKRTKRRFIPLIEQFLRDEPASGKPLDMHSTQIAPLAGPYDVGPPLTSDVPQFDVVVPVRERSALLPLGGLALMFASPFLNDLHLWGPTFLLYAAWLVWTCQIQEKKWNRLTVFFFLFLLGVGVYNSWPLIRRWL